MFNARCLLILTLLLTSAYFYGCESDTSITEPDEPTEDIPLIDSTSLQPGIYRMRLNVTPLLSNSVLIAIDSLVYIELLLPDQYIMDPSRIEALSDYELLVEITDFVGVEKQETGLPFEREQISYHQYNGKILEVLKPEGMDLPVVKINFCQIGDVLQPGERCLDGTGDVFEVLEDGHGQYLFFNVGGDINLFGNINGILRNFSAEKQDNGTYLIKAVTPKE